MAPIKLFGHTLGRGPVEGTLDHLAGSTDEFVGQDGPWLRNEQGQDVFKGGFNSPTESRYLFDKIDLTETFGKGYQPVEDVDNALRGIAATQPTAMISDSAGDVLSDAADYYERNGDNAPTPTPTTGGKWLIYALIAGVALFLLAPVLELTNTVAEASS